MKTQLDKVNMLIESNRLGAESGKWLDQATLGNLLAIKATEISDMALLEEAEYWLGKAAINDKETAEHLKNIWPKEKEIYRQMIIKGEK